MLSDAYYPDWDVRIDGERAEIFPAYYVFRGVVVPDGQHTVEFSYFPTSLSIGLLISTAAMLAGAYSAARMLQKQRRTRGKVA